MTEEHRAIGWKRSADETAGHPKTPPHNDTPHNYRRKLMN